MHSCAVMQADSEESQPLLDELNIEVLPTVQFWKQGKLLWEHRGIVALQQDLGEGAPINPRMEQNHVSVLRQESRGNKSVKDRMLRSLPVGLSISFLLALAKRPQPVHVCMCFLLSYLVSGKHLVLEIAVANRCLLAQGCCTTATKLGMESGQARLCQSSPPGRTWISSSAHNRTMC